jgi:DnaJ family protein A protein 2
VEIERWFYINNSKTVEKETIYITVPPGLDENEMLIMENRGNVLSDFCRGDVKINFQINNTTSFIRQGLDLIYKKKITLKEALCGFTFDIQHLNGKSIHVNNQTNRSIIKPNMKRVIPSLGMNRESNTGNLIIEFDVEFPETISDTNLQIIGDLL